MKQNHYLQLTVLALATLIAVLMPTGTASAAEHGYRTIYRFKGGNDGWDPLSIPTVDKDGNLYGTTYIGGQNGYGTVFKIDKAGKETILYNFTGGADGCFPYPGVIRDAAGNLYGATLNWRSRFLQQRLRRGV